MCWRTAQEMGPGNAYFPFCQTTTDRGTDVNETLYDVAGDAELHISNAKTRSMKEERTSLSQRNLKGLKLPNRQVVRPDRQRRGTAHPYNRRPVEEFQDAGTIY